MIKSNFKEDLTELHYWHYDRCEEFKNIIDFYKWKELIKTNPEEIFIHTNLFKEKKLISKKTLDKDQLVFKSSGTSNKSRSKIFADRITRINQQRALINILSSNLKIKAKNKLNYYVIAKDFNSKENILDAQKAAILGFSMIAKKTFFLLNKQGNIREEVLNLMIKDKEQYMIFGFTSDIYLRLFAYLKNNNLKIKSKNNFLIHGGGWKKLIKLGVENSELKKQSNSLLPGITCLNYYGMIEQTGSIYMECSHGFLHTNQYCDIYIRDNNFKKQVEGKKGIIQSISLLPKSYPGHSLLTEDIGIYYGENNCICGKKGKIFKVIGRLKKSEIRGCSDVY